MTISMSQVQTIRQLKKEGETIAGISRKVGVMWLAKTGHEIDA